VCIQCIHVNSVYQENTCAFTMGAHSRLSSYGHIVHVWGAGKDMCKVETKRWGLVMVCGQQSWCWLCQADIVRQSNGGKHHATHCNTLQHTATHYNTLQHTATHCNTLQHTVTHYNTLQHTATHWNTLQHTFFFFWFWIPTASVHCNAWGKGGRDWENTLSV